MAQSCGDVPQRVVDRAEHPEAEQVELDQFDRLDVAFVVLDHDTAGHRGSLERRDVDQRRGVMSMPPVWIDRCRGKPSIRPVSSSQRSHGDMPTVDGRAGAVADGSPGAGPPMRSGSTSS